MYETNLYALQRGKYDNTWYDLTVPELKAFLGACILMGITRMPRATQYWLKSDIFGVFPVITGRAERYCHFSITIDTKATIHNTE